MVRNVKRNAIDMNTRLTVEIETLLKMKYDFKEGS